MCQLAMIILPRWMQSSNFASHFYGGRIALLRRRPCLISRIIESHRSPLLPLLLFWNVPNLRQSRRIIQINEGAPKFRVWFSIVSLLICHCQKSCIKSEKCSKAAHFFKFLTRSVGRSWKVASRSPSRSLIHWWLHNTLSSPRRRRRRKKRGPISKLLQPEWDFLRLHLLTL